MATEAPMIPAPSVTPPAENPGGLFSVVTFREVDDSFRWYNGVKVDGTDGGALAAYGAYDCEADVERVIEAGANWSDFDAFTVYGTFSCSPVGYAAEDMDALALRRLTAFEEVSAEAYIWENALASSEIPEWRGIDAPTADFEHAVGMLEHYAIRNFGGGVIHVPRHLAHKLPRVNTSGNRVTLPTGVQVVLGSGYGNPGASNDLVVTPTMFGYRSDIVAPYDANQTFDHRKNVLTGVAERRYIIGWDAVGKPVRMQVTP